MFAITQQLKRVIQKAWKNVAKVVDSDSEAKINRTLITRASLSAVWTARLPTCSGVRQTGQGTARRSAVAAGAGPRWPTPVVPPSSAAATGTARARRPSAARTGAGRWCRSSRRGSSRNWSSATRAPSRRVSTQTTTRRRAAAVTSRCRTELRSTRGSVPPRRRDDAAGHTSIRRRGSPHCRRSTLRRYCRRSCDSTTCRSCATATRAAICSGGVGPRRAWATSPSAPRRSDPRPRLAAYSPASRQRGTRAPGIRPRLSRRRCRSMRRTGSRRRRAACSGRRRGSSLGRLSAASPGRCDAWPSPQRPAPQPPAAASHAWAASDHRSASVCAASRLHHQPYHYYHLRSLFQVNLSRLVPP